MSLTTRLTGFFLAALALALAGFSIALYGVARSYLHGELDVRLEAALDALSAAAEVEEDQVEWSAERARSASPGGGPHWVVHARDGRQVDQSPGPRPADFPSTWRPEAAAANRRAGRGQVGAWRLAWRRLEPRQAARPDRLDEDEYQAITLTAGLPVTPAQAALRRLALASAGLSAGLWLFAAVAGRWLCRRALAPLTRMAEAAAGIGAEGLDRRLPAPRTGDELERLAGAFNGLLARLQSAFERQRQFTAEASHQLRTPLTVLIGQVEVACRRERSAGEYRRVLDTVQQEAERMRQVVESLLFLARSGGDGVHPECQAIDLADWLPAQLRRWSGHARAADLHAALAPGGLLTAQAHPPLLAQLLDGLVENACKYSDPGTPITVRAWRDGGAVRLAVEDQGWGLSAEERPLVFEPFYRSEKARRSGRPGVGLGLAVARRIATALGGSLAVESEAGRGSRFTLCLPPAHAADGQRAAGQALPCAADWQVNR